MAEPVSVTVETDLTSTADHAFTTIAPVDLPRIFARVGLLPGVTGTREQTGSWDATGRTRVVVLDDGSTARERLTAYDAPRSFAYRVDSFTGPLARLVDHAEGTWHFTAAGPDRVHVSWTYAFTPRPRTALLVRLLIARLWRPYARGPSRRRRRSSRDAPEPARVPGLRGRARDRARPAGHLSTCRRSSSRRRS